MVFARQTVSIARLEGRNPDSPEKPEHESPHAGTAAMRDCSSQSTALTQRLLCGTMSAGGCARWPLRARCSALARSGVAGGAGAEPVPQAWPGCPAVGNSTVKTAKEVVFAES